MGEHGRAAVAAYFQYVDEGILVGELCISTLAAWLAVWLGRVLQRQMDYRMKKDTVRPQDRVDAERIRELFNLER